VTTIERLSAEDARILSLESGNIRGHACKVVLVRGELGLGEVREEARRRLPVTPRLRQRIVRTPLRLAPPAWFEDPAFTIERHVRAADPPASTERELRTLVARLVERPLDLGHPPWTIDVTGPLDGGLTALVFRFHHAMADGTAAMRLLDALLLDRQPADSGPPEASAGLAKNGAPSTADLLASGAAWRLGALGATAIRAVRTMASPPSWAEGARSAARLPETFRRELRRAALPTPLDRPAGPRREVAFTSCALADLKRIGGSGEDHATVNDVVLAVVGGALRGWLERRGAGEQGLRVKVPVSLHQPGDSAGNRDSFMCVDLPLEQTDPRARLEAIRRETRERKRDHDAETLDQFFHDLSHFSDSLERFAERWAMSPRVFTLSVSNVPGPREPRWLRGRPVVELRSLAEIAHHHALRVSVMSACGRFSFGLCADPDAVDGLEEIARGIEVELRELADAARWPGPRKSPKPPG
jgi:diacylglycerol O-acyltransferase / wax synthase